MLVPFAYRQVEESFFQELCEIVSRGESTVLLAPRFGDSRYPLYRLHSLLEELEVEPLVYLRLTRNDDPGSAAAVRRLVEEAVQQAGEPVERADPPGSLLGPVERLYEASGKPVVLFAANVDHLSYHLSNRLLEEVRTLDQAGKVVAVLTGEDTFYDLVFGPNSEFSCAHQFILQGLSLEEFTRSARHYQSLVGELAQPEIIRDIWQHTGGNRHMLRILLWEVLERRARRRGDHTPAAIDIQDLIRRSRLPGPYGAEIFRHPVRLISHEPRCWPNLQRLIAEGSLDLAAEAGPPTAIELSGVATRKGSRLQFSSPWMEEYVKQHFDSRRWGDLYARNGDWPQAFAHYARLDPEDMVRPATAEDLLEVELTIRSLNAALYAEINRGTDALRRLFARGCRYVLGYQEVAFWALKQSDEHPTWSLEIPEEPSQEKRHHLEKATEFLPPLGCPPTGLVPVPYPWKRLAVAASFPGLRPDQQRAVVLSNFKLHTPISKERERLTHELIGHFLTGYQNALAMERDRERLAMRNKHVEVMNSIFSALGSHVHNVNNALVLAAGGLRRLGYSRVLFCLITPTGDHIQGELDDAEDSRANVAKMTYYPLDPPKADLQPYVIFSRRPKIVPDARREPLANVQMVFETQMKALAIVPLLNQDGLPVGTIHVERKDGAVPSADEVEDLLQFGRQLAIAIEQSERVNLLQAALDKIPEPVLIADASMRLRFTNAPAAELLAQKPGWYARKEMPVLAEGQLGDVWRLLHESLNNGQRLVRQIQEIGPGQPYRGVALTDAIEDWKRRTVGAMLHLQNLNYLYAVLKAFRLIAESKDTRSAKRAILKAASLLGHRRGRLFLVDEEDPERLVGDLTLTPDGQIVEDPPAGEGSDLPRRKDRGHHTWKCIEEKTPIVFCWQEDQEDGIKIITPFGLEAINSNPPRCRNELDKQPGDFWIDFPLLTPDETLGKLSLSCDPTLKPEDFHLLRMLSEMAAGLLDAFNRRERVIQEVENAVLGPMAEEAMAGAAHNILARLANAPFLLKKYREREPQSAELKALNDDLEHTIQEVYEIVARIRERLGPVKPRLRRIDLIRLVRTVLGGTLPNGQWDLRCDGEILEADADSHLLEIALLELVKNSREIVVERDLCVRVSLEIVNGNVLESIRLLYKDNGPGVPDHLKSRIFEPFFSRRPGRKVSTGLGLSFVQRVISAHGGAVYETGVFGSGAQFRLDFPRFAEEEGHAQVPGS
ncbi:MAG TPA: ATP-binding protein [Thermoanaerobaculia bacterium]|nr:ATP-binding protein [Thermoanaerobaculia bacterium]